MKSEISINVPFIYGGENSGVYAVAKMNTDPNYRELIVEIYKGDKQVADLVIGTNAGGEIRIMSTADGMREGEAPAVAIFPERNRKVMIEKL